uniref:Uncharacterized protein LOC113797225 isoform X1 n=1 Tax=Dermatophagoides pteronyssinus TaxID=6956 RepID=A0A6P6YF27_DERPT|nr:uncharacterized protein LOC113797225 isoform X1 [Dermatophagoides pteronyssinus]
MYSLSFLLFVFVFFIPNIFLKPLEELKCDEYEFKTMDNECDCIVHFERKSGKCESIFGYCNQTFQCRNKKFKCSDKTKGYCKPNCGYETDKNCETGCQSTYEDECIPIVQCDDNLKCYGEQVCLKDDVYNGECRCPEGIPDKKYYCTHSITTTFESTTHSKNDTETFNSTPYLNVSIDNNKNFNNSDNSVIIAVAVAVVVAVVVSIAIVKRCVFSKKTVVNKPLPSQITQESKKFIPLSNENRHMNEETPQIRDSETNDETE